MVLYRQNHQIIIKSSSNHHQIIMNAGNYSEDEEMTESPGLEPWPETDYESDEDEDAVAVHQEDSSLTSRIVRDSVIVCAALLAGYLMARYLAHVARVLTDHQYDSIYDWLYPDEDYDWMHEDDE